MWNQTYDPVVNVYLSAILAVIPILFFIVALTFLKLKGLYAALITLVLQFIVALAVFRLPVGMTFMSAFYGIASGLWPICYIIIAAVWLYKIAIRSGKFDIIRASIASVSQDQRIQVILIAFCFGGFLEGAAAFGTPIAICGAMLVELGFRPIKATCLALVGNAAVGAYGAIGIPVIVGAQQADLEVKDLSRLMLPTVQIVVAIIPLIQVVIVDGWRGVKQTVPVWLGVGLINTVMSSIILYWMGPELTNIIAALTSMAYLIALMQFWSPSFIYKECDLNTDIDPENPYQHSDQEGDPKPRTTIELADKKEDPETVSTVMNSTPASQHEETLVLNKCIVETSVESQTPIQTKCTLDLRAIGPIGIVKAWLPFLFLTLTVLIWSMGPFKSLFAAGGAMHKAVVNVPVAHLNKQVIQRPPIKDYIPMGAVWPLTFLNASGTAIVIAILLTIVTTRKISFKSAGEELWKSLHDLWKACVMICLIMAVAYIANFSGASATIGLAISKVGRVFPLLCPLVGWLGVFITGSVVNGNVLFAKLQSVTATQIGVSPTLLVAANVAGGSMGKSVSPQSIAIAAAAVNMVGRESEIMSATLKYSLGLAAGVCVCTVISSFIF